MAEMPPELDHINCWLFDLDLTLYPPGANIMAQIERQISRYVEQFLALSPSDADRVRHDYFIKHGTTLAGLIAHHDADPHAYLDFVHDVDLGLLEEDAGLAGALAALPGRKIVFTNADAPYAQRVLAARGLGESFEAIHDIHAMAYRPKPETASYEGLCRSLEIDPTRALFVEDMARNLKPAKALGMKTVWINHGSVHGQAEADASFIDYETHCASAWLRELTGAPAQ
jgi:putative hydrolase of the HAD superfamily